MKSLAVSRLRNIFGDRAEECRPEKKLESAPDSESDFRKADAYLKFEDWHHQLGKGIIAEVQYRNKGKDIEATTDDYVSQDYSVVWLYEEDFESDRCLLDEEDFLKRAAEAVWPDRAPHTSIWKDLKTDFRNIQSRWTQAWKDGLSVSGAPATLPPEWCDEEAQKIWQKQPWYLLFPDTRHGSTSEYDAEKYIREVRVSLSSGPEETVKLPPEWCDLAAAKLWYSQDWDSLFPSVKSERLDSYQYEYQAEVYIQEVRDTLGEPTIEVNYFPWSREQLWRWYQNGFSEVSQVRQRIPAPEKWFGRLELGFEPESPQIKVKFPPEISEDVKEDLQNVWDTFYNDNYDHVIRLSSSNADRSCGNCGDPADFYLRSDDVDARFACRACVGL